VVSGLGGTKALSIPMFTALRRFSIMMTMLGEYAVLNKEPTLPVLTSVCGMVLGAIGR
jgi:solute carrier family 35 protein